MGMYDNVTGKCPYCGKEFYTQTKLFGSMMMNYTIGSRIFENSLALYASVLLKDVCFECRQPIVMMIENNIITAFKKVTEEKPMYIEGPWGSFEKNEEANAVDNDGNPIKTGFSGGTVSSVIDAPLDSHIIDVIKERIRCIDFGHHDINSFCTEKEFLNNLLILNERAAKLPAHSLPPKEIYDVLHAAEENGINIPLTVDEWWKKETEINEMNKGFTLPELVITTVIVIVIGFLFWKFVLTTVIKLIM